MYNKDLYNKIINASCSFEELEFFVSDIDKKEFDLANAFEKYYDVEKILYAINRYENKRKHLKTSSCRHSRLPTIKIQTCFSPAE